MSYRRFARTSRLHEQLRANPSARAALAAAAGAVLVAAHALGRRRRQRDALPSAGGLDSTLAALREGYCFVSNRCRRLGTDAFATRLFFHRAVCMRGAEAARAFYTPGRFTRRGAIPLTTLMLLQDRGSVQTLDGEAHARRKALFLSLLTPEERIAELVSRADREWERAAAGWSGRAPVVLHDEVRAILCRAACAWAGVPLPAEDVARRTRELGAMIDGAGRIGWRHWHALWLRERTERWIRRQIIDVRQQRLEPPAGSALREIARYRSGDGRLLPVSTAAVELINVLRPVVAVARFITFTALAMYHHPRASDAAAADGAAGRLRFVQEVRRLYPFFPAVGGRSLVPFRYNGAVLPRGAWVLLDLHGTNHDPARWHDPEVFRPDRFAEQEPDAFDLIPQGGGGYADGHRCPGEPITLALMQAAFDQLRRLEYELPPQDLRVPRSRMPALPASGFVIANVRRRSPSSGPPRDPGTGTRGSALGARGPALGARDQVSERQPFRRP